MSDLADMRRRAAQQASYGNYWAGKCVGLVDQLCALGDRYNERGRELSDALEELTTIRVWIRALEEALDPDAERWAAEARQSVADGSVWERIAAQPDVSEFLQHYLDNGTPPPTDG